MTAEPLTSIDRNFFLLDSVTSSQTISCLAITGGVPDRACMRSQISAAVAQFPRSRLRPAPSEGVPERWEDDPEFSLDHHCRYHVVEDARSRGDLLLRAGELFSTGFTAGRPLWCFHVISGPAVPEAITLFLIHHGFGDGGGGMEFFHAVCDPRKRGDSKPEPAQKVQPVRIRSPRSSGSWIAQAKRVASVERAISDMRVRRAPFPFHGENSPKRVLHLLSLPLDRAKIVREALDISLNDVYLAYVAGAAQRLTSRHGYPPGARVFVPFNLRPRGKRRELGNFLSAVPLTLPVADKPIERALRIHEETVRLKDEGSFGAFGLLGRFASFLPKRFRKRLLRSACRRGNFICTNVPSSRQPLVIGGAPILESYGCAALLPEHGISVGFMSYSDKTCISLVSDPALVPEPEEILEAIVEAERELLDEVGTIISEAGRPILRETALR